MKINEDSIVEIIRKTKRIVLSAISKYLNNDFSHAIDDVAQETYIRIYKALLKKSFKGQSKIDTWVYSVAKNEARRMNKKLINEEQKKTFVQLEGEINNLRSDFFNVNFDFLLSHIDKLPDNYIPVFKLIVNGEKIKNISTILGLKINTVKSIIYRGKLYLQNSILGDEV